MSIRLHLYLALFFFGQVLVHGDSAPSDSPATGIAVSGGIEASPTVEVFFPSSNMSCSLPNMPRYQYKHTMASNFICGGEIAGSNSCLQLQKGKWSESITLVSKRREHCSWETEQGILLMGGYDSPSTSEIVPMDGGQTETAFDLKYRTVKACAITDLVTDSVIITGGYFSDSLVSRYDMRGWLEDLPELTYGRYAHGCGSYLKVDGSQVLLVAGGWQNGPGKTTSTEVLIGDSTAWSMVTALPRPLNGVASASLDNTVFIIGGEDFDSPPRDEVLAWSHEGQEWVEKGKLQRGRSYHAATTIQMDSEMMQFCGSSVHTLSIVVALTSYFAYCCGISTYI